MDESIEYKVVRLPGPENQLKQQLDDQGAGSWELAALVHDPRPGSGPYLCIFKRKQQG
jgi:hypothetical protein